MITWRTTRKRRESVDDVVVERLVVEVKILATG